MSSSSGVTAAVGRPKKRSFPWYPIGKIIDPLMVYDNINLGRRIDPVWPDPDWRAKGKTKRRLEKSVSDPDPPIFQLRSQGLKKPA